MNHLINVLAAFALVFTLLFFVLVAIMPPLVIAEHKRDNRWVLLTLVTVPATVILVCLIIRAIGA